MANIKGRKRMMNFLRRPSGMMCHVAYIALVSFYDSWLVILHAEHILAHEHNLVGRYLIRLRGGDVSLFIGCKLLGTAAVIVALIWLVKNHRGLAVPIVRSLTVFQTWLLWFLTCSVTKDPLIPIAEHLMVLSIAAICLRWWTVTNSTHPRQPDLEQQRRSPATNEWQGWERRVVKTPSGHRLRWRDRSESAETV